MTLPAQARHGALPVRSRAPLPKPTRDARLAELTATLGLFGWRADTAPTSLGLIVARTADLSDADFSAALVWLADHVEAIGNPIPALRRAAAEHARQQREAAETKRAETPVEGAVPCPPEVREKFARLGAATAMPRAESDREQRLRGFRKLATVLATSTVSDGSDETPSRAGVAP